MSWITLAVWLGTACGLDDLTRGQEAGGAAGTSPGSAGQAGSGANGGRPATPTCEDYDFCATFEADGPPSDAEFSTIRTKSNTTLLQADGKLEASASSGVDCSYADVGVRFDEAHTGYRVEALVQPETDLGAFFLTIGHRDQDLGRGCLDLLALRADGLIFQTNTGETTIDQTDLRLPVGTWSTVSITSSRRSGGGTRHEIAVGGRLAVVERPECDLGAQLEVTLGFFCFGETGRMRFDNFGVRLTR